MNRLSGDKCECGQCQESFLRIFLTSDKGHFQWKYGENVTANVVYNR